MNTIGSDKRSERWVALLLALAILLGLAPVLFTDQIIRASDVLTQFFWSARQVQDQTPLEYLQAVQNAFHASWEPYSDGGRSLEGGWNAITLLVHRYLIQHYIPFPANIAWLAGIALAFGGVGTYWFCRNLGISRWGAVLAGLMFGFGSENVSLINAGHIQKIEAIAWIPWVLGTLELALTERRLMRYGQLALLLALQFFHMHWQISFYSCLTVGVYWIASQQFLWELRPVSERFRMLYRDAGMVVVLLLLFFSLIAISFAPLVSWSKQSERGGGMAVDQGMSWSMPPEELISYAIPGFFGLSRQEEGDRAVPGQAYYWGRMVMSQTSDYLGLAAVLLAPVGFWRRRDRIGWILGGVAFLTIIMALGGYTPVYRLMFEYLPGFSSFRVPKMILCVTALAVAVLAGRGLDEFCAESSQNRLRLLGWPLVVTAGLLLCVLVLALFPTLVIDPLRQLLEAGTRYQSAGVPLAVERVAQMKQETVLALAWSSGYTLVLTGLVVRPRWRLWLLLVLLLLVFGDLWRVNRRFMVVTTPPAADRQAAKNEIVRFLEPRIGMDRIQPVDEQEPQYYSDYQLPTLASYVTVSEQRYRAFLDRFRLMSGMPDLMNVRYLVLSKESFAREYPRLKTKYHPVFTAATGSVVLENQRCLPKAWTVSTVERLNRPGEMLARLEDRSFDPGRVGLVEGEIPKGMTFQGDTRDDRVTITRYQPNRIDLNVHVTGNRLLILGEKYYNWWYVMIDGVPATVVPVDHILRGVYIPAGSHQVHWSFDPLPFKIGRYLTLAGSLALITLWVVDRRRSSMHA